MTGRLLTLARLEGVRGLSFLPFLAVEGVYVDFGEVEDSSGSIDIRSGLDGWDAFAVGKIPIAFIDLFAKIGVISYDLDVDLDADDFEDTVSSSGEDMAHGIGAALYLGQLGIRAEVERFDVSELDDLYLLSVGATYTF